MSDRSKLRQRKEGASGMNLAKDIELWIDKRRAKAKSAGLTIEL